MALINRSISNMYNGVSQQPPSIRLPSQAEVQENALSSVVYGVEKRPPTQYVAKLNARTDEDAYVHTINRDVNNQYVVVIVNGDIFVYDIDGTAQTVSFPDGTGYLSAANPMDDFACITVADYTFVVNKSITCTKGSAVSGGTYKGSKQTFLDLPASPANDDVWEIGGDANNSFDNYYVKYNTAEGIWRETIKPALLTSLQPSTMPMQLVNNGGGAFTLEEVVWNPRTVGDDNSAVFPSFVTQQIKDVFFHRNRLGFIAGENVVFSRAGDYFNFFPETTTAILDTDPVDVAVSHTKVATLKHALAFNTSLILFADQAQFQLTAKDVLSPASAAINVTTEFSVDSRCKPASASTSIFFSTTKGNFSSIKEYAVQPLTFTNDASDITAHVPKYLPKNLFKLASSNLDDILVGISLDNRNEIYVYKYYWSTPDEKAQSAWSKWTVDAGAVILNADFIDTNLFMVVKRSDGMYIEKLNTQQGKDTDVGYRVHLDQRINLLGAYDVGTNLTTFTTPYLVTGGTFKAVLDTGFTGQEGTELTLTEATSTTLTIAGDYSASNSYVGREYTMLYTFSPIYWKDDKSLAVPHYKLKIKNFKLLYSDTGTFTVAVTPVNRSTNTYVFTGKTLGDTKLIIGDVSIGTGIYKFPVFADATQTVVSITSSSALPVSLQSAEYEASLNSRSKHL